MAPDSTNSEFEIRNPKSEMGEIIRLEQVNLQFGQQQVLRDLTVAFQRGQKTVIIGESGCGKTVLLKLIIGLLRPQSGQVWVDGKTWSNLSERDATRERLRFGFLFQGAALFDSLSVYDNVAFALREHSTKTPTEIQEQVRQRLLDVGLPAGVEQQKPAELSGGMKKRVGLARAVVMNPEIMLYDEPTTGLDPIMSDVINELILQTSRDRVVTSIVVTHDMKTVQKVADRVLMLAPLSRVAPGEQQIIFDGTLDDLRRSSDSRVTQFVEGQAGERLKELVAGNHRD